MIISRTPLRMSFVGGGSDLPSFYRQHGGAVLSTAIDKYIYISVNKKFDGGIRVAYSKTEEVDHIDRIEHRLVRTTMEMLGIPGGVEITSTADIPSHGTGLGSSSAFTVGLINALHAYLGRHVSADQLGSLSCEIEIDRCGEPIGKQDQYASAFGGLSIIEFHPDDSVLVTPLVLQRQIREALEKNIVVFYTGIARSASGILKEQSSNVTESAAKQELLKRMVALVYQLRSELQDGKLDSMGEILDENWQLKKQLASGVTNTAIDDWYAKAKSNGALGGKLLGAGAGGFLMFYAPAERHDAIERALGLRRIHFGFESLGSRIIFYNPTDL
ncbi:GHMP kinase [Variovorax sp. J22R24]|uniref:GHMP family kinase ATP-binding protein n=1 Tax=Variovorax gracilis TaxID=3053502 RepID=UPI0025752903|nr:GHMP kinase [Variovorax sp. J22R24]MDM0108309.1 GHMP kinase [Variovorax sp. J22R24]